MTLLDDAPNLAHLFAHGRLGTELPPRVSSALTPEQHEAWNHTLETLRAHALGELTDPEPGPAPEPDDPEPAAEPDPEAEL